MLRSFGNSSVFSLSWKKTQTVSVSYVLIVCSFAINVAKSLGLILVKISVVNPH